MYYEVQNTGCKIEITVQITLYNQCENKIILSIVWYRPDDGFEENKDGSDKHGGMDNVQRLDIFLIPATDTAILKLDRTNEVCSCVLLLKHS